MIISKIVTENPEWLSELINCLIKILFFCPQTINIFGAGAGAGARARAWARAQARVRAGARSVIWNFGYFFGLFMSEKGNVDS